MYLRLLGLSLLLWAGMARAGSITVIMTRGDALNAFNAIAAIGEYTTVARQAGQDVAVKKYLEVSLPMRAALTHDVAILRGVTLETVRLQDDARARLDGRAFDAEIAAIGAQTVTIDGLTLFSEADLQLDKNPQITPLLASALLLLESK